MLYIFLFFISILLNPALHADIAPAQFDTMLEFINKTDLASATARDYKTFMNYAEQIVDNGSNGQRTALTDVLGKNQPIVKKDTATVLKNIDTTLKTDVMTPEVMQKNVMGPMLTIDATGTDKERKMLNDFVHTHKESILDHCKKLIPSILHDPEVRNWLTVIINNTVNGALPFIGLTVLKMMTFNLSLANAGNEILDLGILCALDSLIRYDLQNESEYVQTGVAAGLSMALQGFAGFYGPTPTNLSILGKTIQTPELAAIKGILSLLAQKNLNMQSLSTILPNLDWKELFLGETKKQLVTAQPQETKNLTTYVRNILEPVLSNETVRSVTASVVSYAVEGALLAAALNTFGFGEYGTTTTAALTAGMMRGALEGLATHASRGLNRAGIVQRVVSGTGIALATNFLTNGVNVNIMDIAPALTPVMFQQIAAAATEQIIAQKGGWGSFIKELFTK